MSRVTARAEVDARLKTIEGTPVTPNTWTVVAFALVVGVAEVADAVRDVAAAIREARS